MPYYVYIAECSDGTYYCGTSVDPKKRLVQHNISKVGAKYTRSRRPIVFKYIEELPNKSEALRREFALKKLTHEQKKTLITSQPPKN